MSSSDLSLTPRITINELDVSTISNVEDASTSQLHQQNDFIYVTEDSFGSKYKSYFIMDFLIDFHKDDHAYQQEDKFAANKDNFFSNQPTAPHCIMVKMKLRMLMLIRSMKRQFTRYHISPCTMFMLSFQQNK